MDQMMAHRRNGAWLAAVERPALLWLAERLPATITPNVLTTVGVLGAILAVIGYALASRHPTMLWIASAGIGLNWFGDSLDGTVARWRRIERPRYGYFLDNSVDLAAQALLAVGLGLSGYVRWDLALAGLAAFFMITIVGLLRAQVSGFLDIACFGIGLTEIRLAVVAFNVMVYIFPPQIFHFLGFSVTYPNLLASIWLIGHILTFVILTITYGRRLAAEDPPRLISPVPRRTEPSRAAVADSP